MKEYASESMDKVSLILSRWRNNHIMKDSVMVIEKLESALNLFRHWNHQMMICHTMMVVIMVNWLQRNKNVSKDIQSWVLIDKVTTQKIGISVMGILEMLVILNIYGTCFLANFVMRLTIVWLSVRNIWWWSRKWNETLEQSMRNLSQVWRLPYRWESKIIFVPIVIWMGIILKVVGNFIWNFIWRRKNRSCDPLQGKRQVENGKLV